LINTLATTDPPVPKRNFSINNYKLINKMWRIPLIIIDDKEWRRTLIISLRSTLQTMVKNTQKELNIIHKRTLCK